MLLEVGKHEAGVPRLEQGGYFKVRCRSRAISPISHRFFSSKSQKKFEGL